MFAKTNIRKVVVTFNIFSIDGQLVTIDKTWLDTSRSPIFFAILCIRQIKSISGEANECCLHLDLDTKFIGIR